MEVKEFIEKNKERIEKELREFVSYKSVSTDEETFKDDLSKCRQFLIKQLELFGCKTQEFDTKGIPAVYGELIKDEKYKTVLIYGHYDVQPAEKEDGWKQDDPFKLEDSGERWYGRGVSDNKGPAFAMIKAVEYLTKNDLKLNIKFLIEGEEEKGSEHFFECIEDNKDKLSCDLVLISDTEWATKDVPAITYGFRGIIYFYTRIDGPKQDIHSGSYGGMIKNPHIELIRLISKCIDDSGKVLIPGFYDGMKKPNEKEIGMLKAHPINPIELQKELGGKLTTNDKVELLTKGAFVPTFEVHGITGGYLGKGGKTIIPSYAEAKMSVRVAGGQDADKLFAKVEKFLKDNNPDVKIIGEHNAPPFLIDPEDHNLNTARKVMEEVFGKKTIIERNGASIPATFMFQKTLGKPVILPGINWPDCGMHTPSENMVKDNFYKGIEFFVKYLREVSK